MEYFVNDMALAMGLPWRHAHIARGEVAQRMLVREKRIEQVSGEVRQWLAENCVGQHSVTEIAEQVDKWAYHTAVVAQFDNEDDAFAFKMRFG